MIYKFRLLSDEVENFRRDIEIDSEATFYDLHKAILSSVNYPDDQMTSFFICNDNWEKENEITLEDMGSRSDDDNWVMKETALSELLEEEKQHLIYTFDPLADRVFFIELSKITYGENKKEPQCVKSIGEPPTQTIDVEEILQKESTVKKSTTDTDDFGEEFYGSERYDEGEIDPEGYDIEGIADSPGIDDTL